MTDPTPAAATPCIEYLHVSSLDSDKTGAVEWVPPGQGQVRACAEWTGAWARDGGVFRYRPHPAPSSLLVLQLGPGVEQGGRSRPPGWAAGRVCAGRGHRRGEEGGKSRGSGTLPDPPPSFLLHHLPLPSASALPRRGGRRTEEETERERERERERDRNERALTHTRKHTLLSQAAQPAARPPAPAGPAPPPRRPGPAPGAGGARARGHRVVTQV